MTTEITSGLKAGEPPQSPLPDDPGRDPGEAEQLPRDVQESACSAARATQAYVRSNPWKAVGLMAAAGVFIGILIRRR